MSAKKSSSGTTSKTKIRKLTVENDSEVSRNDGVSIVTENNESRLKGSDRLVHKIKNLLTNQLHTDVVLKNKEREFFAHKLILSAWSPVFAAMFQHNMIENEVSKVDISDCTTEAFEMFLQFVYSGSADSISCASVVDLYYIADKYQVECLKTDCVECMKNSLSVDCFCDIMRFSVMHDDLDLKSAAVHFFCQNIKEIVKTDQWLKYLTDKPKHANLLFMKSLDC